MDEANPEFSRTDVAVVVGANDVVNPDARNNQGSPIYGMPILNVDDAQAVVVLKRSMNPGFAGIENPLFYNPKTVMLFGDAKESIVKLAQDVKSALDEARGVEQLELRRRLAEDRVGDELAAREAEHVAVARVAGGDPEPSRPGTRPTSGSMSCVRPKMPAQRCVMRGVLADQLAEEALERRLDRRRRHPRRR